MSEDFIHPQLYQILTHGMVQDLPHYERLVQRFGGPILELGAGLGRIANALLSENQPMVLVEHSPAMCESLGHWVDHQTPEQQQNTWVIQGDICAPNVLTPEQVVGASIEKLPQQFGCIILGLRTVHLFSEEQRSKIFALAQQHLHPDGAFIIHHADLQQTDCHKQWQLVAEHATEDGVLEIDECFYFHALTQRFHLRHRIHQSNHTGQQIATWRVAHDLYGIDKVDIQQQLAEAGFMDMREHHLYAEESLLIATL